MLNQSALVHGSSATHRSMSSLRFTTVSYCDLVKPDHTSMRCSICSIIIFSAGPGPVTSRNSAPGNSPITSLAQ